MREIQNEIEKTNRPITPEYAASCVSTDSIIAYETARATGLGILMYDRFDDTWGFVYHSDAIKNEFDQMKFIEGSPARAMKKVLKAGRRLICFDTFEEFVAHAAHLADIRKGPRRSI